MSDYLKWRDDNPTMVWGQFFWDGFVVEEIPMKELKLGLTKEDKAGLKELVEKILEGADGDAALANSPVTLTALGASKTAAVNARTEEANAKSAWKTARTTTQTKYAELFKDVKRYALYAYSVFGGDKAKLQALGLNLVEVTGEVGILPAPANVRSRPDKLDGTIKVLCRKVRGGVFYTFECAEDPNGTWNEVYRGPRTSTVCEGLTPGKVYYFRVRAWGTSGPGVMSDITSVRAR